MNNGASLDPDALATLRALDADNPGSFSEFVRMFVSEAPELVRKIEAGSAASDQDGLTQSAHYLRSAALALGATELAEVCHSLEHPPAGSSADDREQSVGRLRHAVRDALLALLLQVRQI